MRRFMELRNRMGVLEKDFEYVSNSNISFDRFKNKVILITGATGLVGSLLVKNFAYCNKKYGLDLKIIAIIRNTDKAKSVFGELYDEKNITYISCDLEKNSLNIAEKVDYIVHCAAVTASKDMIKYPVDCLKLAANSTLNLLELARTKSVINMVFISSMEVYGILNTQDHKITENQLGYVNLASVRSCYPEGKRYCECLCNAYAAQYNVNVVTARLAQTFGAGILKTEYRVFAQFAKSILYGEDVVLHTKGLSEGNYVYSADAIIGIMILLLKGVKGDSYNISNEDCHTTIAKMAEMLIDEFGNGKQKVVYDISPNLNENGYAPDVKMHLSAEKMQKLGWNANIDLKMSYAKLLDYMKQEVF